LIDSQVSKYSHDNQKSFLPLRTYLLCHTFKGLVDLLQSAFFFTSTAAGLTSQ
jgi:hypothetical protein